MFQSVKITYFIYFLKSLSQSLNIAIVIQRYCLAVLILFQYNNLTIISFVISFTLLICFKNFYFQLSAIFLLALTSELSKIKFSICNRPPTRSNSYESTFVCRVSYFIYYIYSLLFRNNLRISFKVYGCYNKISQNIFEEN